MTERVLKKKLARLNKIEKARVKYMRNWNKVDVYVENGMLITYWNGTKIGYHFHKIERPLSKLDYLIKYHNKKLKERK